MLDPALHARTLDITGPEELTLDETASVLAVALGRPVEYIDLPMEQALAGREGFDRENDFGAYDRIRRGMVAVVDAPCRRSSAVRPGPSPSSRPTRSQEPVPHDAMRGSGQNQPGPDLQVQIRARALLVRSG
ncbi:hypothetical protein [Nocardioides lacusdianchii]|uniref:hypothetical protein n=1 Tax=Nocardioides lacusdianchii TaxID=2783664 RepID=UPI001CCCC1C6|nr:hypothetical protein [Nocardioides lacusdianchii]